VADVALAALVAGLVLGRLAHVALNVVYFRDHPGEILQFQSGGLNWHGALLGALLASWLAARLRRVPFEALLGAAALALPLIAFAGWWGCGAAHCAYGAEVENLSHYPGVVAWEEQDIFNLTAPRFAVQPLGMMLAAALLGLAALLTWRGWLAPRRRFGVILVMLAAGMFGLGFLRGDYALDFGGLRADQWLDLALILLGLVMVGWPTQRDHPGHTD
jgi:phosphatidylglycerol:prolipoprotein diacylglycerol transferase